MARIQCLEHVVGLFAVSDLTDDQSVWTHAKRVLYEIGDIQPTVLGRFAGKLFRMDALELDPVGIVQLKLRGVLDRNDAFFLRKCADNGPQQGALSRAGSPSDQDVGTRDSHGIEEGAHLKGKAAGADPVRPI